MSRGMRRTRIPGWYEFSRIACPICGHAGGCMQHKDGNAIACIRIESDRYFSKNSSLPSYLHFLKGDKKRKKINDNLVESHQGEKKKGDLTLHNVYTAMLSYLDLDTDHYEHLTSHKRRLTDEQIDEREYRSFPEKPWSIVKQMQQDYGLDNFKGVPGFYEEEGKYGKFWSLTSMNGILIPFRNYKKQIVGFQYRIDNPPNDVKVQDRKHGLRARVIKQPNIVQVHYEGEIILEQEFELNKPITIQYNKNTGALNDILGWVTLKKGNRYYWLSSANKPKGTGSGDPAPVHVSVPLKKFSHWETGKTLKAKKIWLSEGPLKTDIASDLIGKVLKPEKIEAHGDTFLALPGVNAWRLALPIMKEMGVEEINLCFDADVVSNIQVKTILMECTKELKKEGYHVNMVIWNEKDGKGIDDLLLNNKIPQFKSLF
ncbi:DUF3854 domain-containing protein [Aquibacillus sp. 3ASR75-11]|uniref:DUF3854 domain-containing protein n=1 Tax=Terrihalobacillus insolitus TaxID=2950438 RepID=A0A9X3WRX6_9BACI|nr:DUF3854 domain-containing protein [Terrihalobacillus insolitus]MDC3424275.1 DUF3854 domain-containing protein [Terrihalobacillus insolitus]